MQQKPFEAAAKCTNRLVCHTSKAQRLCKLSRGVSWGLLTGMPAVTIATQHQKSHIAPSVSDRHSA